MEPVTLTDGVLVLRPPRPSDAATVLQTCQDPEITRWTSIPSPYTAADAEHFVNVAAPSGWAGGREPVWYACAADAPDIPLVSVGFHDIDLEQRTGEIGYFTVPEARNRGITTAAVRLVCRWAFDELGLRRIGWQAFVGNDASLRVAERIGFVPEGRTRSRLVARGDRHDGWVAGLLPGDLVPAHDRPITVTPTTWSAEQARSARNRGVSGGSRAHLVQELAQPDTEITAGSLHLRPWHENDVEALVPQLSDPETVRWNPFPGVARDPERAAQTYVREQADWSDGRHASFAVVDATTGELLGGVSLHHADLETRIAEVGYWTGAEARERGVARRAVSSVSRWAFAVIGLERIEAYHALGNTHSCSVATAAGYPVEATLRSSYLDNGVRHDEHLHARLAGDAEPV